MQNKRAPAVANYFYPGNREALSNMIRLFFSEAGPKLPEKLEVFGAVVPHAGYFYSGKTASYSYKAIAKNPKAPKTFVILGPNHTGQGKGVSIYNEGEWQTPLGNVKINKKLAEEIAKSSKFAEFDSEAHAMEHSIEVQLPFLQVLFNDFSIVPICLGYQEMEIADDLANALLKSKEQFCIIASSDLNHYESDAETRKKDSLLIRQIEKLDIKGFYKTLQEHDISACGYGAIATLMLYAKARGGKCLTLYNTTSAESSNDFEKAVGYCAMLFYK